MFGEWNAHHATAPGGETLCDGGILTAAENQSIDTDSWRNRAHSLENFIRRRGAERRHEVADEDDASPRPVHGTLRRVPHDRHQICAAEEETLAQAVADRRAHR